MWDMAKHKSLIVDRELAVNRTRASCLVTQNTELSGKPS